MSVDVLLSALTVAEAGFTAAACADPGCCDSLARLTSGELPSVDDLERYALHTDGPTEPIREQAGAGVPVGVDDDTD